MIRRHFLAGAVGLKAMCAATALTVGVGQVEAATVVNYDLRLRYEGTSFSDVTYYPTSESWGYDTFDVPAGDTSLGLKSIAFGSMAVGEIVRLLVTVVHGDGETDEMYDNGGRTPMCQIGPWSCTATTMTHLLQDQLMFGYLDEWLFDGSVLEGGTLALSHATYYLDLPFTTDDGSHKYSYANEYSTFTVLPAPVPLPATAALLPLGIGALALMRKRRRLIS